MNANISLYRRKSTIKKGQKEEARVKRKGKKKKTALRK